MCIRDRACTRCSPVLRAGALSDASEEYFGPGDLATILAPSYRSMWSMPDLEKPPTLNIIEPPTVVTGALTCDIVASKGMAA